MRFQVSPEDTIIVSGNNGGLWLVPTDDCPLGGCKSIQWEQVTGQNGQPMMQFTMLGSSQGWLGMAISADEKMVNNFSMVLDRFEELIYKLKRIFHKFLQI